MFRVLLFIAWGRARRPEPHVNFGAKRRKREARCGQEHLVDLESNPPAGGEQIYLVIRGRARPQECLFTKYVGDRQDQSAIRYKLLKINGQDCSSN